MYVFDNHKYYSQSTKAKQALNRMRNKIEDNRLITSSEKLRENITSYYDIKNAIDSGDELIKLLTESNIRQLCDEYQRGYDSGKKDEQDFIQGKRNHKYENPEFFRRKSLDEAMDKWSDLY